MNQKITYHCIKCGDLKNAKLSHIFNGCLSCKKCSGKQKRTQETAENELNCRFIVYKPFVYENNETKIECKCTECGEYKKTRFIDIINGVRLCSKCGIKKVSDNQNLTQEESELRLNTLNLKYEPFEYTKGKNTVVSFYCKECGELLHKKYADIFNKCSLLCNRCQKRTSTSENEIKDYIISLGFDIIENYKIKNQEIDVFIPKLNIGIEYNGLYWHSEQYKPSKNFHLNKMLFCSENNIQLFYIWEDEWLNKKDIVKSRIDNILHVTKNRIFARKCVIKNVPTKEKTIFLEENHIQGKVNSTINIGLYYNDELISIMTFGYGRNNEFLLSRFCSKINHSIVGGFSKLFNYFLKEYPSYNVIKSFAEYSFSNGDLYSKNGFNLIKITKPDYYYIIDTNRVRKQNYTHKKLIENGFDKTKSEHEIMLERKIYRIYDCGKMVYVYNK